MRLIIATLRLVEPGGSETYALTVGEHLARLGHEVMLYGRAVGDPIAEWAQLAPWRSPRDSTSCHSPSTG